MGLSSLEDKTLTGCPFYSLFLPDQGVQGVRFFLEVHSSRIKATGTRRNIGKQLDRKKIFLP